MRGYILSAFDEERGSGHNVVQICKGTHSCYPLLIQTWIKVAERVTKHKTRKQLPHKTLHDNDTSDWKQATATETFQGV